ncbi:peptidoglycan D,D-transpeptidase FtsI family protein [Tepidibacillus infernus]|uniref:peptidoglycan D,D-transpeptidase FtsI family protein n=1 Tax=Tepidibacillus infernus TaxID=1806172 RepID=UPI003B6EF246
MAYPSRNKRRMFQVLILLSMLWVALLGRLSWIQIIATRDFSSHHIDLITNSIRQRKQEFILSNGRGNIYDRNQQSLLGQKEIRTVIIFPFIKQEINSENIKTLADILNLNLTFLTNKMSEMKSPNYLDIDGNPIEITFEQQKKIEALNMPGILATTYTFQDAEQVLAKHVIGFLGQAPKEILENETYQDFLKRGILKKDSLIGRSGLQKSFQELLMGVGESKIAYFVDNQRKPLNGLASKYQIPEDPYYPLSLITTIDKEVQSFAEKELRKYGIEDGSVVVLDAKNADILAMASAPDFQLDRVNPISTDWNNKAVQVIEPGSIFKTVVAIAGLEEGVVTPQEKFAYQGEYDFYHFSVDQDSEEMTFSDGYADSINFIFGKVAEWLGPEKIEEYADKLGLVGQVGWRGRFFNNESFQQIDNEQKNRVFHENTNKKDLGSILRTAIGQQDVRISPLAAANLVVTVLNDGEVYQPRLVEKVVYKNGADYYQFSIHKNEEKVGSPRTYEEMRKMMEKVVEEGTGKILRQAKWKLAGKSGTAETDKTKNNQWFIGYGPVESPKYAVAVAVKNVSTSKPLAKQVFMGIMDDLADYED